MIGWMLERFVGSAPIRRGARARTSAQCVGSYKSPSGVISPQPSSPSFVRARASVRPPSWLLGFLT